MLALIGLTVYFFVRFLDFFMTLLCEAFEGVIVASFLSLITVLFIDLELAMGELLTICFLLTVELLAFYFWGLFSTS